MAKPPKPIVRRVREFSVPKGVWERPAELEALLNAKLEPTERIVGVVPGPKLTAIVLITETDP